MSQPECTAKRGSVVDWYAPSQLLPLDGEDVIICYLLDDHKVVSSGYFLSTAFGPVWRAGWLDGEPNKQAEHKIVDVVAWSPLPISPC